MLLFKNLFESDTTDQADVVLPAASFAEVDGTYTNNTGFVQRVRKSIEPVHQSKPDWMITSLVARELGSDFGYNFSASAVFKSLTEKVSAYEGLRYPNLKDESRPAQVKHAISTSGDLATETENVEKAVEAMSADAEKNNETPKVGHKLFRLTTLTSKTNQFHLLANGNPKPESLLVSPLEQFNLDGTEKGNGNEQNTEVAIDQTETANLSVD